MECEKPLRGKENLCPDHMMAFTNDRNRGERSGFPPNGTRWSAAMAGIRDAQGDPDGALELLDEAERLYVSDFSPNVRPVSAVKARVWVAHGRVSEALAWARERGLSAEDDLSPAGTPDGAS